MSTNSTPRARRGVGKALAGRLGRRTGTPEKRPELTADFLTPPRLRLLGLLFAIPGGSVAELSAPLGVAPTTGRWHLQKLKTAGLAESRETGRGQRFWPRGAYRQELGTTLMQVRTPPVPDLLAAIMANPGIHQVALAKVVGHVPVTIAEHLAPLIRSDLVREVREGRRLCYLPGEGLHKLVAKVERAADRYRQRLEALLTGADLAVRTVRTPEGEWVLFTRVGTDEVPIIFPASLIGGQDR